MTRVRNEAMIIEDTLRHALSHVDRVILYDDCSSDATTDIATSIDRVEVIRGDEWRMDRKSEETRHRAILLDRALQHGADWCWCFDADERLEGDFPALDANGYRFRLFDGYMTADCGEPYRGGDLAALPRMWGPEYRDILMLFRVSTSRFEGQDRREPIVSGRVDLGPVRVRHYGKCLSVNHWEETCDYYATYWPEPYRSKWAARRGKAIHEVSDQGRALHHWNEVAAHGVRL